MLQSGRLLSNRTPDRFMTVEVSAVHLMTFSTPATMTQLKHSWLSLLNKSHFWNPHKTTSCGDMLRSHIFVKHPNAAVSTGEHGGLLAGEESSCPSSE